MPIHTMIHSFDGSSSGLKNETKFDLERGGYDDLNRLLQLVININMVREVTRNIISRYLFLDPHGIGKDTV